MKYSKLISTIAVFACTLTCYGQLQVHTALTPAVWAGKLKGLEGAPKEILIPDLTIHFQTSYWAATGDVTDGLGVASYIHDLDDELAQSIANDAKEYLIKKFGESGVTVNFMDAGALQSNAGFKKDFSKGKAEVKSSGVYRLESKMASKSNAYTSAIAEGSPQVFFGAGGHMQYHTRLFLVAAGKLTLALNPTFYMVDVQAGSSSSSHSVSSQSQLAISAGALGNGAAFAYYTKKQLGVDMSKHILVDKNPSWAASAEENKELYGISVNYKVDPDKFRAQCGDMMKMYLDNVIAYVVSNTWGG